jgi:hypothetical protein
MQLSTLWFGFVECLFAKQPPLYTRWTSELECATLYAFEIFVLRCQVRNNIQHNIRVLRMKVRFVWHQSKPIISYHSHRKIPGLAFHIRLKINKIVVLSMTWPPSLEPYGHGGKPPRRACIVLFSCTSIVLEAILPDLVPFQCKITTIIGKGLHEWRPLGEWCWS